MEKVIYRSDTVYVKKVEYISAIPETASTENTVEDPDSQVSMTNLDASGNNKFDEVIFPSKSYPASDKKTETIKIKFSAFTARSN